MEFLIDHFEGSWRDVSQQQPGEVVRHFLARSVARSYGIASDTAVNISLTARTNPGHIAGSNAKGEVGSFVRVLPHGCT